MGGICLFIRTLVLRISARLFPKRFGVTVVITSCERHDLLERTLASFLEFNNFPIEKFIIIEDGDMIARNLAERYLQLNAEWLSTGYRVGQIAAVDYAYSRVDTPYIFHLEDDWEFYASGFIDKSMLLLLFEPRCLQVWLRALDDTNRHPAEPRTFSKCGIAWRRMAWDFDNGKWHGFSFNPGLRRVCDYISTKGYGSLKEFNFNNPWQSEVVIGKFYRDRRMHASILSDRGGTGYVRHIGDDRHTPPPSDPGDTAA
jgi:hypothetical protein